MMASSYFPVRKWRIICVGVLLNAAGVWAESSGETNRSPLAVWDTSVAVSTGIGYRENVLRSSIATENSGFFQTAFDASVMRLSETDSLFMLFFFGEDTRYFNAPSVNYEQVLSGTAQWSMPVGARHTAGLQANYLYQHQILDASATEVFIRRILVLGHSATLRPSWKYALNEGWSVELEGVGMRQIYEQDLDDYWEGGGQVNLARTYGHRSKASLSIGSVRRFYDTRLQYDGAGFPVLGTELAYQQTEGSGQWRHYWDADRRWRTTSQLGYMLNRDNGSGYFDYDRLTFRQQVRWERNRWSVWTNARFGYYFHKLQRLPSNGESRHRSYATLDFRVERKLGKHWMLYANAEHEWNMSNDPLDEYRSWVAGAGVGLEF